MSDERAPLVPDVDIWVRAFSRNDPDPLVVHAFGNYVRNRQVFLVGWVRQGLLARVRDERGASRLAWVLGAWPDLPLLAADHERAASLQRSMRGRGTPLPSWTALMWATAERLQGTIWSRERHWQVWAAQGCPVKG